MSQAVIIKSNKYGIHLILDKDMSFPKMIDAIIAKLKNKKNFSKMRGLESPLKEESSQWKKSRRLLRQ